VFFGDIQGQVGTGPALYAALGKVYTAATPRTELYTFTDYYRRLKIVYSSVLVIFLRKNLTVVTHLQNISRFKRVGGILSLMV
jgi:hypothetical protein